MSIFPQQYIDTVYRSKYLLPILGFAVVTAAYYHWTWSHILAGRFGGDNAVYLLTAEYFSLFLEPSAVAQLFANNSVYPPLFPAVLAILGGGKSVLAAHLITTTFLLASFVCMGVWYFFQNMHKVHALWILIIFAMLPGTYFQALYIHSESLYLFLSLLSLLFSCLYNKSKQIKWLWFAALVVGAASITRGAGLTLIVAFCLYILLNNRKNKYLLSVLAVSPYLIWNLLGKQSGDSYLQQLINKYGGDESIYDQLTTMASSLWHGWLGNFSSNGLLSWFFAGLFMICLLGLLQRVYQKELDGFYAGFYLLLILVWPFPAEAQRLIIVIIPILLFQGMNLLALLRIEYLFLNRIPVTPLFLASVTMVLIPDLLINSKHFFSPIPDAVAEYRRSPLWYDDNRAEALYQIMVAKELASSSRAVNKLVPANECIYSIKPSIVAYYSKRRSYAPPIEKMDDEKFIAETSKYNCKYYYMILYASPTFRSHFYPYDRLKDKLDIIDVGEVPSKEGGLLVSMLGKIKISYLEPRDGVR